ncbi:MAG: type II-A CRISPR-associated protein Csn2 [Syntrophobacterales bacterium]|jgi:CRISPR type II-A-associated protein Csn2|nr:type II-A CRISPR-associated protein Csn2 [Syntrophobacterales bacterium]
MNELTLSRYGIEPSIIIPETNFFTLVVENKKFLLQMLTELRCQIEDGKNDNDDGLNLSFGGKPVDIEKNASIIFDFTDINFNSKTITNLLTKKFAEFLGLGEQSGPLMNLEAIILNLAENFRLKSGLNIEYDAVMNGSNLAKVCSLKIADDKRGLLERLCEYVNLLCDLKPLKLLILVFGKEFLSKMGIDNFYKHCCDKNVRVLIIEGIDKTGLLENERRLIIDADLCTIPLGYAD